MLCSRFEIRRLIQDSLLVSSKLGDLFLLTIGDFDKLKEINYVYGRVIVDFILASSYRIILDEVHKFCKKHNIESFYHDFSGDEFILLLPGVTRGSKIKNFLDNIRERVEEHFTETYVVASMTNFGEIFSNFDLKKKEEIQRILGKEKIFVDPTSRKRGSLFIAPLLFKKEKPEEAKRRVVDFVNKLIFPECERGLEATLEWLYDEKTDSFQIFNEGYCYPVTISFGAITYKGFYRGKAEDRVRDILFSAQKALMSSKKRGNFTTIGRVRSESFRFEKEIEQLFYPVEKIKHPIVAENVLRKSLSLLSKSDNKGVIFQIIPQYCVNFEEEERNLRLKDLNDRFGYDVGDIVIIYLEAILTEEVKRLCSKVKVLPNRVIVSRSGDVFKIYFHSLLLSPRRLVNMMSRIIDKFNETLAHRIIVSFTVSVVFNRERIPGDLLLSRLENTVLSEVSPQVLFEKEGLLVKEYAPGVEEESERIVERRAYLSATKLKERLSMSARDNFKNCVCSG